MAHNQLFMPCFIYNTYKTKLFCVKPFISLVWDSMICLQKNHRQGNGIETFRQRRAQDARASPAASVAVNCAAAQREPRLGAQVTEHKKRQFKLPIIIKCADSKGFPGIPRDAGIKVTGSWFFWENLGNLLWLKLME